MNQQEQKALYHSMPKKYQKGGDMPTQYELQDSIDAYLLTKNR